MSVMDLGEAIEGLMNDAEDKAKFKKDLDSANLLQDSVWAITKQELIYVVVLIGTRTHILYTNILRELG